MERHEAKLAANDLEIYFKGFEIAIKQNKMDDAVHCLNKMKGEIDYNLKLL